MNIDIGAYGALGSMESYQRALEGGGGSILGNTSSYQSALNKGGGTISQSDAFQSVAGAPTHEASQQAMTAFTAASKLRNRTVALSKTAIAKARLQWENVANDIEEMGGTEATRGAGYGMEEDYMMMEEPTGLLSPQMKPYLYTGLAIAGAAAIYLVVRK